MKRTDYRLTRDPLFIGSWLLYFGLAVAQQWLSVPPWIAAYGRDVLLVPCVLPLLITALTRMKIRVPSPPTIIEILLSVLIWSIMFELLGPEFFPHAVADVFDILAYCAGGIIAGFYWHLH
ncbi:hypothetical protein GF406_10595 [candidate division KSB1 bacterium]|nr:hypothetical protein [candidate division KSB1 bacterium]